MRWMDQPDIRKQKLQENNSKPIGDPHVYHDLSMFLASSHHNRGIATAALKALMGTWYIPRSKVKNIEAGVFNGNKGSARVLEKSGWILEEVFNLGGKGKTQSGELIETIESYYWRAARPSGTADEVTVHNV
ncbi:hypothetical protein C8Q75DRAFT_424266 [Abortiporus biennis]|nr:hypothetical protein C8Q75DRAFT_424266 [Abortiporus biennis]